MKIFAFSLALTLALALQKIYFDITNSVLKISTFMFFLLLSYLASQSLCYKYLHWTMVLTNMILTNFWKYQKNILVPLIIYYENSHTNPGFNEQRFLRIPHDIEQKNWSPSGPSDIVTILEWHHPRHRYDIADTF